MEKVELIKSLLALGKKVFENDKGELFTNRMVALASVKLDPRKIKEVTGEEGLKGEKVKGSKGKEEIACGEVLAMTETSKKKVEEECSQENVDNVDRTQTETETEPQEKGE